MVASKRRKDREVRYTKTKEWVDNQERGWEPTAFTIPEGMQRFKWKLGWNRLDFIPFRVGEGNPEAEEGLVHWTRLYHLHEKIGPEEKSYSCLARTFKKRCPVCEETAKMRRAGKSDDELDIWKIKDRRLFYVKDLDDKDAGVQVLETGIYKSFGELFQDELDMLPEDSTMLDFFHLKDGMTVEVYCKEDTYKGKKYNKPVKIRIVPRKKQYSTTLLDEVPSLDDVPKELSYKELKALFLMEGDEDDSDDNEEEETVKKKSKKKSKKREEDEDDLGLDEDDEEEEEEDEPKSKKKSSKKKVEEDEEEDDDESDEDDEGSDEEDEEEDDESEDEDEGESDDDGEDGDEEEEEDEIEVGDLVVGSYKGKRRKGKVKKVLRKKGLALVEIEGISRPWTADLDELAKVEEEEEDEDEPPKKSKKKGKKKAEEEEDDIPFDEDEEDDSDDDDDEEEEPIRKSKRR